MQMTQCIKLTDRSIDWIAQGASEYIFKALAPYQLDEAALNDLAFGLDESIADLLKDELLDEE